MLLLIVGSHTWQVGLNPDLQKMRALPLGTIELAMAHTAARSHAPHISGLDDAGSRIFSTSAAHAVLVRQLALQHITDDLHIAVDMGAKAGVRGDTVFIDDMQHAKAHALLVHIVRSRENG